MGGIFDLDPDELAELRKEQRKADERAVERAKRERRDREKIEAPLRARVKALLDILKRIEWQGTVRGMVCPFCGGINKEPMRRLARFDDVDKPAPHLKGTGHHPNCFLRRQLDRGEG